MKKFNLSDIFNQELNSKVSKPFLHLNNYVQHVNQRKVNESRVNQRHTTTTQVNVTTSSGYPYFFNSFDGFKDEGLFNKLESFSSFKDENKLFYPKYQLRNDDVEFPNTSVYTVPGPYPYEDFIDKWALDNKYNVGSKNYSGIILHFGHTHIMSLHNKIQAIRANPKARVASQTKVLDHLLYASTRIFLRFAGLIGIDNKPLEINPIKPSGQLKMLFKMMITGYGTKAVGNVCGEPSCDCSPNKWSGVMDPMGMLNTLRQFVNNFIPNSTQAPIYCNTLEVFLRKTLKLDTTDPISFMSWYQLLDMHQKDMFESYIAYKKYYGNKTQSNKDLLDKQNKMSMHGGAQLGAFFGFFYTGLIILDTILDERSIPFESTYSFKSFKRERNDDPRDMKSWDVIDEGIAITRQNKTALYNPYAYINVLNNTMSIPNAAVIDAISSYANWDDSKYSPYITRPEDIALFSNNLIKKGGSEGIKWGLLSNLNFPIDAPYFNKSLLANIGDPTNFVSFRQIGSLITLMGYPLAVADDNDNGVNQLRGIPIKLDDPENSIAWVVKKDDGSTVSVFDNRQANMLNKDLACYIPSTGKYFRIIISNGIPSDPLKVADEIIETIEEVKNEDGDVITTNIIQTKTIVTDDSGNPYNGGLVEWTRSDAIKLDSAVPGYKLDSLEMILYSQVRWWSEHVLMFNDYCKASALNDDKTIYSVSVNMLESCSVLGVTVGRIFEVCDLMIRNRRVFDRLDDLKPISNLSVY